MTFLFQWIYHEQQRLILWVPAFMIMGIFLYFDMPYEPTFMPILGCAILGCAILGCAILACTGLILTYRHYPLRLFFSALLCIIAGFFLITFRTYTLNTVMLKTPIEHATITGKIANIDDALHKKKRKLTIELIDQS